jgi:putative oxidoreductase
MAVLGKLGNYKNLGLLFMRVGLGAMMILHGYPKILGGPDKWEKLGKAMGNFGIDFFPVGWGAMAAGTEVIGGLLLVLGWYFRPACIFLLITMIVAAMSHIGRGQGLLEASHAIEVGFAFLGLMFLGPGKFSVDKN